MSGSYAKSKKCPAAMQCGCKERWEVNHEPIWGLRAYYRIGSGGTSGMRHLAA